VGRMLRLLHTVFIGLLSWEVFSHEVFQSKVENTMKEVDTVNVSVIVGANNFTCTFVIAHRDSFILMDESSVDCTPNTPLRQTACDVRFNGSHGYTFAASILINPDVIQDINIESLTPREMIEVAWLTNITEESFSFGCNTPPQEESFRRGAAGANIRLWPGGVVPYVFTPSFTYTDRLTFAKAVEIIEASTCLKFVGRSNQRDYIRVERECACGGSCFGGGYTDGLGAKAPRRLVIGAACISPTSESGVGLVIHEALHALGVVHTQNRPDRDEHIWVDFDKITAQGQYQYKKCDACNVHNTPYDCMSVMHYRDWAFSRAGKGDTMLPRRRNCDLKTATNKFTKTDAELLNRMYSCKTDVAIDGQWSKWSDWSECNAKCGTGRQARQRLCNNPKPSNGGKSCPGEGYQEQDCFRQACKGCARMGKNTKDRVGSRTFSNVRSWEECSLKCSLDATCTMWTWNHENAGRYAFKCSTMTSYGTLIDDSNSVSGTRACQGCPEKNVNLQDRKNNQVIPGVKSWDECAKKCKAKSSCTAWAWAHEGAGPYALNCGLMDEYGKKVIDENVISGNKDCPDSGECTGLTGSSACCSKDAPCPEKGGDCDDDDECQGDLVCGFNNCKDFQPNAVDTFDCCIRPIQKCNGEEGTGSCCTAEKPCEKGGGDCDSDDECAADLVCGTNNCRNFNPRAGEFHDCCMDADGGWGEWSEWSECTYTRDRECNNPAPENGGAKCPGKKEETATCS